MSIISGFLLSKFEEAFEQMSGAGASPNIPPISNPSLTQSEASAIRPEEESRGKELEVQCMPLMCADPNFLQDSGGMMKIVPSDVDVSAASSHG